MDERTDRSGSFPLKTPAETELQEVFFSKSPRIAKKWRIWRFSQLSSKNRQIATSGNTAAERCHLVHGTASLWPKILPRMFIIEEIVRINKGLYEKYSYQKWVWFIEQTLQNLISKIFLARFLWICFILGIKTSPSASKSCCWALLFVCWGNCSAVSSLTAAVAFSRLFFGKFWRDIFQFFGNFGTPPTPWVTFDLFVCESVPQGRLKFQVNQ